MTDAPIIFFDGVCNLCNGAVNWIIDRDKNNAFKFSALQSAYGQSVLRAQLSISPDVDSIILLEQNTVYIKSTAALRIAKRLGGIYALLYAFIVVPKFIRDAIYDVIAKNRYKWFGTLDQCRIPTPELKAKFID